MRTAVLSSLLAVLGGCAVVPPAAWNYDPTQPPARTAIAPADFSALSDRVAQLRIERDGIRARIAAERDIWRRQGEYAELHRVGRQLSPLERQLALVEPAR